MLIGALAAILSAATVRAVPPVPGGCTAPASDNVGKPGCYLSAEILIPSPPRRLFWHILAVDREWAAWRLARIFTTSTVIRAHGRWWVYALTRNRTETALPRHHVAGPFELTPGRPVTARFMESWFPPGMRTRVHSHSGPESFYVVDGQQCTETPGEHRLIGAGQGHIVLAGPHLQAAPQGRRNLVLVLASVGEPWMRLEQDWPGPHFCG